MGNDPVSAPLLPYYDHSQSEERTKTDGGLAVVDHESNSHQGHRLDLSEMVDEMKQLCNIALPMIITGLLVYGKSAVSMHFLGKLGKETLAGGCLAIGVANITGYSLISGLAAGMEGISSQACGAKQWSLMAHTLQRTIIILILTCIPISLLWLNFQPIFLLCGQKPTISSIATTYLASSIPNLFFQSLVNPLKIYFRTQNVTLPLIFSAAFTLALHFPINFVVIQIFNLGVKGVAFAAAFTDFNLLVFLLVYLRFSGAYSKSWRGWSCDCFYQWKPILRQAVPSCISVCLEWWWYELLIVLSGFLTNAADSVAATGIIIQATALAYNFPFALNLAVSTRVGNELGAYRPSKAKASSFTALLGAICISVVTMLFMVSTRNAWGRMFTEDEAIVSLLSSTLPVVGLCELGNCPQTTICGVLRGSTRPSLGAKINLLSFYAVGLPVSVILGFVMNLGFLGLWLGLLAAQVVCAIGMMIVLARTDWELQAERARELTSKANIVNEENKGNLSALLLLN